MVIMDFDNFLCATMDRSFTIDNSLSSSQIHERIWYRQKLLEDKKWGDMDCTFHIQCDSVGYRSCHYVSFIFIESAAKSLSYCSLKEHYWIWMMRTDNQMKTAIHSTCFRASVPTSKLEITVLVLVHLLEIILFTINATEDMVVQESTS